MNGRMLLSTELIGSDRWRIAKGSEFFMSLLEVTNSREQLRRRTFSTLLLDSWGCQPEEPKPKAKKPPSKQPKDFV